MIPFVFACVNLSLIQPGPAIVRWAAQLLGKIYQQAVWSLCAGTGLVVLTLCLKRRTSCPNWPGLVVAGSLSVIAFHMTIATNEAFHIIQYGLLGYLLAALSGCGSIPSLITGSFFGIVDELIQAVLPNRVFEIRDILLNLIAVAAGIIVSIMFEEPHRSSAKLL